MEWIIGGLFVLWLIGYFAGGDDDDSYVMFEYIDARGCESTRKIINWHIDGEYLKGTCTDRNAFRTFRRDRIQFVIHGDDDIAWRTEEKPPPPAVKPKKPKQKGRQFMPSNARIDILFTGFDEHAYDSLSLSAKEAGMIVRKRVAKELSFICVGDNRPSTPLIAEAKSWNSTVLTEAEFFNLIDTGEIPK